MLVNTDCLGTTFVLKIRRVLVIYSKFVSSEENVFLEERLFEIQLVTSSREYFRVLENTTPVSRGSARNKFATSFDIVHMLYAT